MKSNPYLIKLISLLTGKNDKCNEGPLHKNKGCFDRFANTTVSLKNEELQRKNVFINYLHSQISLKATDNPLSSTITRT